MPGQISERFRALKEMPDSKINMSNEKMHDHKEKSANTYTKPRNQQFGRSKKRRDNALSKELDVNRDQHNNNSVEPARTENTAQVSSVVEALPGDKKTHMPEKKIVDQQSPSKASPKQARTPEWSPLGEWQRPSNPTSTSNDPHPGEVNGQKHCLSLNGEGNKQAPRRHKCRSKKPHNAVLVGKLTGSKNFSDEKQPAGSNKSEKDDQESATPKFVSSRTPADDHNPSIAEDKNFRKLRVATTTSKEPEWTFMSEWHSSSISTAFDGGMSPTKVSKQAATEAPVTRTEALKGSITYLAHNLAPAEDTAQASSPVGALPGDQNAHMPKKKVVNEQSALKASPEQARSPECSAGGEWQGSSNYTSNDAHVAKVNGHQNSLFLNGERKKQAPRRHDFCRPKPPRNAVPFDKHNSSQTFPDKNWPVDSNTFDKNAQESATPEFASSRALADHLQLAIAEDKNFRKLHVATRTSEEHLNIKWSFMDEWKNSSIPTASDGDIGLAEDNKQPATEKPVTRTETLKEWITSLAHSMPSRQQRRPKDRSSTKAATSIREALLKQDTVGTPTILTNDGRTPKAKLPSAPDDQALMPKNRFSGKPPASSATATKNHTGWYTAPNGQGFTTQDLEELWLGVWDEEKQWTVRFLPSFIEDPWAGMKLSEITYPITPDNNPCFRRRNLSINLN